MLWPDFKFGGPQFNEATFDHWVVVEAVRVPIDQFCLAGRFLWAVALSSSFTAESNLVSAYSFECPLGADFQESVELTAGFEPQTHLTANFNC